MPYTEEHFDRMEHDPILRRAYYWTCGQKSRLLARELRRDCDFAQADLAERFGRAVLENLDVLEPAAPAPPASK